MARIPLLGGAYANRSVIANYQRCINYYPELNRQDAPVPFTFYQRPGLRKVAQGVVAPVRGLYRASNGSGYCVIGQVVYAIGNGFVLTQIGALGVLGSNPVSFIDNGTTIMLVDGSPFGYLINMLTNNFSQVIDATGTFAGATRVDILDTFILWNMPGTIFFGSTLSNTIAFDATYFAGKAGYPDPLVNLFVNRRQILLLGALKAEIWYNAGNANFPFAEVPGAYIEHGCIAPFSACQQDVEAYWLGEDLQGQGIVFKLKGYEVTRISNFALENAILQMLSMGFRITDAIGYTYQQAGHVFYVLSFPTGNQTWVYDASIGDAETAWHQRAYTDQQGLLNRDRGNCHAFINGSNVIGDWQNGALYVLDPTLYVDQVIAGTDSAISCIKGFPHLQQMEGPDGSLIPIDGKTITVQNFRADMQVGEGALQTDGTPAQVGLNWSDTRGRTWMQTVLQTNGAPGDFLTQPQWGGPVGRGRDIVFELSHSINGAAALNGAWVNGSVANN